MKRTLFVLLGVIAAAPSWAHTPDDNSVIIGNLKCVAYNRRRSTWPWSRFFVQCARILGSHRQTRCLVYSPALVAIANNGLKVGRYSAGSLSATMLFGKTLTKF